MEQAGRMVEALVNPSEAYTAELARIANGVILSSGMCLRKRCKHLCENCWDFADNARPERR